MKINTLPLAASIQHTTQIPVSRVKMKADGQLHGWRSSNEVRVERYRRPDAPVLGCWIRVKLNAASRCDHWDAVMAVLVLLRGRGQGAFLQSETLACASSVMSSRAWRSKAKVYGHAQMEIGSR
jgi:hypothetical protein